MKITSIEPQRKKERFNIFLDGEFAFGVSAEILFEKKLKVGQELSEKDISEIIEADQTKRLLDKALRFLSYRPRSEKETRGHLLRRQKLKEVEKSEAEKAQYEKSVDNVIKKLKGLDQINDKEFALWWVEQRRRFRPMGMGLIRSELIRKGIDRDIVEEAINLNREEDIKQPALPVGRSSYQAGSIENTGITEEELAKKAALKKIVRYKKLEPQQFRIKMGQYLARRGFDWSAIKKVVDSLIKEE